MARRRKMTPERREFINGLLEHYQPTDAQDVQEMLKDLLGDGQHIISNGQDMKYWLLSPVNSDLGSRRRYV